MIADYHTLLTIQRDLHQASCRDRRPAGRQGDQLWLHGPGIAWQRRGPRPASRRGSVLHQHVRRLLLPRDRPEGRALSRRSRLSAGPRQAVLGDCWHRFYVRMLEVVQSMDIVRQAIDKYQTADGDWGIPIKVKHKLPKGEVYLETEAPKGQMGFYLVSDGSAIPWRARARSSCFCNLSVTSELCRGCLLADVPAVVGSLDIVLGEIDR